jgi:hypothetical protein
VRLLVFLEALRLDLRLDTLETDRFLLDERLAFEADFFLRFPDPNRLEPFNETPSID